MGKRSWECVIHVPQHIHPKWMHTSWKSTSITQASRAIALDILRWLHASLWDLIFVSWFFSFWQRPKGVDDLWYHTGEIRVFVFFSILHPSPQLNPWPPGWLPRPSGWPPDPLVGLSELQSALSTIYLASQTLQIASWPSNWPLRTSDCPRDHSSGFPYSKTLWQASESSWLAS